MSSSVPDQHKAHAPAATEIACALLTVSDSKTAETDRSGDQAAGHLRDAGFAVASRAIVKDDPPLIEAAITGALDREEVRAVITSGGTGLTSRDSTYEVVTGLLDKELTGFGELFRWLSYEDIGAAAMMSRATAGSRGRKVIIALPGSPNAVDLAMTKLVVPELRHLIEQVSR